MARRGNNEGTIVQRKDGRWEGKCYVLLPNGRRVRRSVYGRTRAEVAAKLAVLQNDARQGIAAPKAGMTVAEYLATWLEDVAKRKLRPRTFENYEMVVRVHLVPGLGRKRLDRLNPTDVRRFLHGKADEGLAASTVKKLHVVLGSALQAAVRDGLVARNVARLVQVSVPDGLPHKPWDLAEGQRFLQAVKGERLEALWSVALALGLRRGEIAGLRWEDVDLDAGTLRVEQTLQRTKACLAYVPPKTRRSRRTVPLPNACVDALKAHRERQDKERADLGKAWTDTGLVFTTSVGTAIEPRNISRSFEQLCHRAKLRRIRLHDLRHTCATLLLVQGVSARVVMEILGHSQIAVTMNTYTHVVPELQRDAVDRLANAFESADDQGDDHGSDGVVVKDVVNEAEDTDPENDEGPPERP
jgi:integrase